LQATSLMPVRAVIPILYGDGLLDDTLALQAIFDEKPCWLNGALIEAARSFQVPRGPIRLPQGTYRISAPLFVRRSGLRLNGSMFEAGQDFDFQGGAVLNFAANLRAPCSPTPSPHAQGGSPTPGPPLG
jgi:hypothetical protein